MHWLILLGIFLIAAGTILTYLGSGKSSKVDNDRIVKSIHAF